MASCVSSIRTKNYQNLLIGFQVPVENVGDVFFETQCTSFQHDHSHPSLSTLLFPEVFLMFSCFIVNSFVLFFVSDILSSLLSHHISTVLIYF